MWFCSMVCYHIRVNVHLKKIVAYPSVIHPSIHPSRLLKFTPLCLAIMWVMDIAIGRNIQKKKVCENYICVLKCCFRWVSRSCEK